MPRSTLSDVVQYAQRTLAECLQFFFCAGRAGFPEFCKLFAQIFAQNLQELDARPPIVLHENSHRLEKELQRSSEVCETTLAEFTQLLCARRVKNFRDLGNFFARVKRKICVTPTLDACFFGFKCISRSFIQRTATFVQHAQRTLGECTQFCARYVPNFRNFANFSRDLKGRVARLDY